VGGYFVDALHEVKPHFSGKLLGVIEDTENGHKRYLKSSALAYPVISVARSPLKNPEDYLVGEAIVFSTEALLRAHGDILNGRKACVIGYGKLGRSIAASLHAKRISVTVFDRNPVRTVEAMSHGLRCTTKLENALKGAGLVICATGNHSLGLDQFSLLENGAYVATVTSSDDELDMTDLHEHYREQQLSDHLTRFQTQGHYFYVLNRGNAVNFVHGAHVGPFIFLVQAELIASISRLTQESLDMAVHENNDSFRERIALAWLECFGFDGYTQR
jgi:adenosylhomocysteinase